MEVIKSWALSFMAAAAITAVISFLSPSGTLDKSVKTVTALFMLLCFIVPFVKADISEIITDEVDAMSEWIDDNKLEKEVENEVVSMLESSAKSRITSYLQNIGVKKSDINLKIEIDESNNINIEKISIVLFENKYIDSLEEFVKSEFGILPEITVCSEG